MRSKIHLLVTGILFSAICYSQPDFSQAFFNKMNLNPAFTGVRDITAPDTTALKQVDVFNKVTEGEYYLMGTFQMPIDKIRSGVGIMVNYNNYLDVYSQYASKLFYRFMILPCLYVGASAGFAHINFPPGNNNYSYPPPVSTFDADIGVECVVKSLFFGLSLGHVNDPGYWFLKPNAYDMPNYSGVAFNSNFGFNLDIGETRLCMMACFYNNNLSLNCLVYPYKSFFLGISSTVYYDGYNKVPLIMQDFKDGDYSFTFMAGFALFNNRFKTTLGGDYYPSTAGVASQSPNLESIVGYGFK